MRILRIAFFFFTLMTFLTPLWARSPLPSKRNLPSSKKRKRLTNVPHQQEQEGLIAEKERRELRRLFAAFAPQGGKTHEGLEGLTFALRAYLASRWGLRAPHKVKQRWRTLTYPIRLWTPVQTYRLIYKEHLDPRFFGTLKAYHFSLRDPKKAEGEPRQLGQGGFSVNVSRLPRKRYKSRPYRFELDSYVTIKRLAIDGIDKIVKDLFHLFTVEVLGRKGPFPLGRRWAHLSDDDRRILDWFHRHLPRTMAKIHHFLTISQIIKRRKKGLFELDLRMRWHLKNIKKEYPRLGRILSDKRRKIRVKIEFLDRGKYPWLVWTYDRAHLELRFHALLSPEGFMMFDKEGKPVKGPWRPSQHLHTSWLTRAEIEFASPWLDGALKKILITWKVRRRGKTAHLYIRLAKPPVLILKDGYLIRLLARLFIPGGIRRLFKNVLRHLVYADHGKGLRWHWELTDAGQRSFVQFHLAMPIVPNPVLTSIFQTLSYFSSPQKKKRKKIRHRRKYLRKKRFGKRRKRGRYGRYRRRRRRWLVAPIWVRIYRALHQDLTEAASKRALSKGKQR